MLSSSSRSVVVAGDFIASATSLDDEETNEIEKLTATRFDAAMKRQQLLKHGQDTATAAISTSTEMAKVRYLYFGYRAVMNSYCKRNPQWSLRHASEHSLKHLEDIARSIESTRHLYTLNKELKRILLFEFTMMSSENEDDDSIVGEDPQHCDSCNSIAIGAKRCDRSNVCNAHFAEWLASKCSRICVVENPCLCERMPYSAFCRKHVLNVFVAVSMQKVVHIAA